MVSEVGLIVTEVGGAFVTVTEQVAFIPLPSDAAQVIVAVPRPTTVTTPFETATTDVFEDVHVTAFVALVGAIVADMVVAELIKVSGKFVGFNVIPVIKTAFTVRGIEAIFELSA